MPASRGLAIRTECIPHELDTVSRSVRRLRVACRHLQRMFQKALQSEAMDFEEGRVGYRSQQTDMQVVHAVGRDRQVAGLRQVGRP